MRAISNNHLTNAVNKSEQHIYQMFLGVFKSEVKFRDIFTLPTN
ncbi:hypothetical protein PCARR_b0575 [Pseudoalteromonas carrageenovora IAM 12662]|uniref:Transposase n=1 Tax=Pseudoalteromonas carrageenovora IAM 12662 TaxID=1314868 RepID=A0ABR9EVK1_PSEVC|nr:hypothetical protein [Pseudoalteromonas carrageenovora IAM 12662]